MRYLLDTNVFDYINKNPESLSVFINIEDAEYFYTDIQLEKEFIGISPRKYDANCDLVKQPTDEDYNRGEQFKVIANQLNATIVPRYANFMKNHLKADGSAYLLPESGAQYEMVMKIKSLRPNKRKKAPFSQEYDAMIAASAIRNDCIFITNDQDLYCAVKEYFPDKVIYLEDLLKKKYDLN